MRIKNLEIKQSTIDITALDCPVNGCDTCEDEGEFALLEVFSGRVHFHATVGTQCAEKYLRMLAE